MQNIAAENNYAETAYIVPNENGYHIRWFTPTVEVDLCGHATLATAHILFETVHPTWEQVTFASRSGELIVRKEGEMLMMDFPADHVQSADEVEAITAGLGRRPTELYRGRDDYMAVFDDEETIVDFAPNMELLATVSSRGIIVTAPSEHVDFVSRFFAPQSGISEDPVTGSAHTALTPFWADRLGKKELRARQLSARGGSLLCRDLGERVEIGGRAVTYLVGEITLP